MDIFWNNTIRNHVCCPDILRYQVTDLICLNISHLAEFGYGKYPIILFLVSFGSISGLFGLAMGILEPLLSVQNMNAKEAYQKGTIRFSIH